MRRALIIGIDDYDAADGLTACCMDAKSMAALLSANEDGSENFQCVTLLSGVTADDRITPRPERAVIKHYAAKLLAPGCDLALFYFAGHGVIEDSGGYLLACDSVDADDSLAMRDLIALANRSSVREILFILDCCHAGALGASPELGELALLRCGVTILSASMSSQPALSSGGHGVFTQLLCAALSGEAADSRGRVTSASVYTFVDGALSWWQQRPVYKAHISNLSTLRRCRPRSRVSAP